MEISLQDIPDGQYQIDRPIFALNYFFFKKNR